MWSTAAVIVGLWLVAAVVLSLRLGPALRRARKRLPPAPPHDRQE